MVFLSQNKYFPMSIIPPPANQTIHALAQVKMFLFKGRVNHKKNLVDELCSFHGFVLIRQRCNLCCKFTPLCLECSFILYMVPSIEETYFLTLFMVYISLCNAHTVKQLIMGINHFTKDRNFDWQRRAVNPERDKFLQSILGYVFFLLKFATSLLASL